MSVLEAQNISVERGGRRVVRALSAALEPGAMTAICGPNGAGKSSLLLALAGLLPTAEGAVSLGQRALESYPAAERARKVGYLPQGADIAWDVSVESLVALGRHPHGDARGAVRDAIGSALSATQMEAFRSRPVSQLSGGEKARALLARVLAGEPDWILADEPLAALDLAHQLRLIGHLRRRADAGQGVVIVLHDLTLAMNHADRVLVLDEGELAADGAPEEALDPAVVSQVWGVDVQWLGEDGARAPEARG